MPSHLDAAADLDKRSFATRRTHDAGALVSTAVPRHHAHDDATRAVRSTHALARQGPDIAHARRERPIRLGQKTDLRLALALAHAGCDDPPADARSTGSEEQREAKEGDHASRAPEPVACFMAMGERRRRRNHGERSRASEVASRLLSRHVPRDQMRLSRVREVWEEAATAKVAERAWPSAVSGDELLIDVHDNQWLHELTYLRQDLLARIRARCPVAEIGRIRLRLGPVPRRPARAAEPEEPPRAGILPPEPSADTRQALDSVSDPDLRNLIAGARVALGRPPSRRR